MSVRQGRSRLILSLLFTLAAALNAPRTATAQGEKTFTGRLSPVPIDVTMQDAISGVGSASAVLTGHTLVITGTFEGLQSPATVARVHKGPKGLRGPAIFDLTVSNAISGTIAGKIELTPQQVTDLENGRLYVQLHSESAPEGNLWGWLLPKKK